MARETIVEDEDARHLAEADTKLETAVLGRDVELWVTNDPIGQFIVTRAQTELQNAMEELVDCPAHETSRIAQIQQRALVARSISAWLGEAVRDGRQAEELLQHQRDGEA